MSRQRRCVRRERSSSGDRGAEPNAGYPRGSDKDEGTLGRDPFAGHSRDISVSASVAAQAGPRLCRHHLHARSVTECAQQVFAILPGQTELAHVVRTEAGNDGFQGGDLTFSKISLQESMLRPAHQLYSLSGVIPRLRSARG